MGWLWAARAAGTAACGRAAGGAVGPCAAASERVRAAVPATGTASRSGRAGGCSKVGRCASSSHLQRAHRLGRWCCGRGAVASSGAGWTRSQSVLAGPSPRVRGSQVAPVRSSGDSGSIPACAGKPPAWPAGRRRRGVPSPRVRGSPLVGESPQKFVGSIPACAGKPQARDTTMIRPAVHPRVCGEALMPARIFG